MQVLKKPGSRKKFLLWSLAAFCSATVLKFFPAAKKKQSKTIKMLTQDGTLVEVSENNLCYSKRKITEAELKTWVKNNPPVKTKSHEL